MPTTFDQRPRTAPGVTRAATPAATTPRRAVVLVVAWLLLLPAVMALSAITLGALAEARTQHQLLAGFRLAVAHAEAAAQSPLSAPQVLGVPRPGAGVALLQLPRLGLQRVVLEGARAGQTQRGPGHVSGTAGLGQPGNAAVAGRRTGYGAPFAGLDELRPGDPIVVTTTQGQVVYLVIGHRKSSGDALGPSTDDRLTLLTAAARGPAGWGQATVVTAKLQGKPFAPTPQATLDPQGDGRHGDPSALPTVLIWAVLLTGGAATTVVLYRRWLTRSTYLLTTPALVALTVLCTDAVMRLLPAWI